MKHKPEQLIKVYGKIKTARSELSADFKEKDKKLVEQQDEIKKALLDWCEENGAESCRTEHGTFYRSVKTRYVTSDWPAMYQFIQDHNVPEFFEKRLNQSSVKQFLQENPDASMPEGLRADSEYVITVRKS
tara:strand:+ start:5040 stop:5432 length:393 start_codon:yes stop_codon:yes gene_type:complete